MRTWLFSDTATKTATSPTASIRANPNGAFYDIAGICNREGNIFGLMPHPERAMYWWQQPDWTRQQQMLQYGDGKLIFQSIIDKLIKNC